MFSYSIVISKKAVFSKKTVKNCFGGTFDHFLGEEGVLLGKLTDLFYHKLGRASFTKNEYDLFITN